MPASTVAARVRALPVDLVLATGFAGWSLAEVVTGLTRGPLQVTVPAALAMSVPFLWRRRFPLVVGLVVAAAFAAQQRLGVDVRTQVSTMAEMPSAAYAVAAFARLRPALAVLVVQVALVAVSSHSQPSAAVFAGIVLGGGWIAGGAMRVHRRRSAALAFAVVREQQRAETAALEERTRIARELHDIVAHAVSVMVIQAGAASEVMASDPAGAAQALDSVRATGRQALDELRRLLGVLRAEQQDAGFSPQPGLDRLPAAVVQRVGGSGLAVDLRECGRADVVIRYEPHSVEVRVVDDGLGPVISAHGAGHGLDGIRERVTMFGGSLTSGPADGGGFEVYARLPLTCPAVAL